MADVHEWEANEWTIVLCRFTRLSDG